MSKQLYRGILLFGVLALVAAAIAAQIALAGAAKAAGEPGDWGQMEPERPDAGSPNGSVEQSAWAWKPQVVDMPGFYAAMSDRSLVYDGAGTAYLAYGGDRLYLARWNGESWSSEVVDDRIGVGQGASLALDDDGRPTIAYIDSDNRRVMVAHWDGSNWQRDVVGPTIDSGRTAIALDSLGRPHVAYQMDIGWPYTFCSGIGYASWTGAGWQIEKFSDCGTLPSLVLDALDRPHISFFDEEPGLVKYATKPAAEWLIEVVGESSGGYGSAIDLDGLDRPHVLYVTQDNDGQLMHAWPGALGWQAEALGNGDGGLNVSLAIDDSGIAHIAHGSSYLTTTITMTVTSTVAIPTAELPATAAADVNQFTSIALDGDNRPAISYVGPGSILNCARLVGDAWQTDVIAAGASAAGLYNAIDVDGSGQPHIGYINYMGSGNSIRYAFRSGDTWTLETITGTVDPDGFPVAMGMDLAVATDGTPHAAFLTGPSMVYDLYYGRRISDTWQLEQLDTTIGQAPALKVDSQGRPHLVYKDWNQHLLYGVREAGGWQINELTFANSYSAFALDDSDNPHFVYASSFPVEQLTYAYWDGSDWQTDGMFVIKSGSYVAAATLAVDAAGRPHVAYILGHRVNGVMKYTLTYSVLEQGEWSTETVDDRPGAKYHGLLTLDGGGNPQIVYEFEKYGSPVQVATRRAGGWTLQSISAVRSGHLDSADRADAKFISHADTLGGRLMLYETVAVFPESRLPIVVGGG